MTINVQIKETSYGSVRVEVAENATEEQIYEAAYNAYCDGKAYFGGEDFDTMGWEKE